MLASDTDGLPAAAPLAWRDGVPLNPPSSTRLRTGDLLMKARRGSDLWRETHYGFTRDSAPALLFPLPVDSAMEVDFVADLPHLYDQAGILVRADAQNWLKAGVECSDGVPQLGAVVTHLASDWSCAPVPHWHGALVTVRASRGPDALLVRARIAGEPWRTVRLAPFRVEGPVSAGPYCAAPERAGLTVRFTRAAIGPADASLHL